MAGAAIVVPIPGLVQAERELAALEARFGDLTPLMETIGMVVEVDVLDNFEGEHTPEGIPWAPSIRAQETGGKTLQDTRRLYQSITSRSGARQVEVGTNVVYAARHQGGFRGTEQVASHQRTMRSVFGVTLQSPIEVTVGAFERQVSTPARAFLGVSAHAREEIEGHVADYVGAEQ